MQCQKYHTHPYEQRFIIEYCLRTFRAWYKFVKFTDPRSDTDVVNPKVKIQKCKFRN